MLLHFLDDSGPIFLAATYMEYLILACAHRTHPFLTGINHEHGDIYAKGLKRRNFASGIKVVTANIGVQLLAIREGFVP